MIETFAVVEYDNDSPEGAVYLQGITRELVEEELTTFGDGVTKRDLTQGKVNKDLWIKEGMELPDDEFNIDPYECHHYMIERRYVAEIKAEFNLAVMYQACNEHQRPDLKARIAAGEVFTPEEFAKLLMPDMPQELVVLPVREFGVSCSKVQLQ